MYDLIEFVVRARERTKAWVDVLEWQLCAATSHGRRWRRARVDRGCNVMEVQSVQSMKTSRYFIEVRAMYVRTVFGT